MNKVKIKQAKLYVCNRVKDCPEFDKMPCIHAKPHVDYGCTKEVECDSGLSAICVPVEPLVPKDAKSLPLFTTWIEKTTYVYHNFDVTLKELPDAEKETI